MMEAYVMTKRFPHGVCFVCGRMFGALEEGRRKCDICKAATQYRARRRRAEAARRKGKS